MADQTEAGCGPQTFCRSINDCWWRWRRSASSSSFSSSFSFPASSSGEQLREACVKGQLCRLCFLVRVLRMDVNSRYGPDNDTPVSTMCRQRRMPEGVVESVLQCLFQLGADVNHRAHVTNATPLVIAVQNDNEAAARMLCAHPKCDLDTADDLGETPLIHACKYNKFNMAKILLKSGADTERTYSDVATLYQRRSLIRTMPGTREESMYFDVSTASYHHTPVVTAFSQGCYETAKLLILWNCSLQVHYFGTCPCPTCSHAQRAPPVWWQLEKYPTLAAMLLIAGCPLRKFRAHARSLQLRRLLSVPPTLTRVCVTSVRQGLKRSCSAGHTFAKQMRDLCKMVPSLRPEMLSRILLDDLHILHIELIR